MSELLATLQSQLPDAAMRRGAPYGVLVLQGPDAVDFAHRLCTQDVVGLEPGAAAPAAFLSPKGKLIATAWIGRAAGDAVWVEVQEGVLDEVASVLDRFHFTEKLEIVRPEGFACTEVLGPGAAVALGCEPGSIAAPAEPAAGAVRLCGARRGVAFVRWHGPEAALAGHGAGLPELSAQAAELWRIASGRAQIGVDTEPTTLALEADIDDHVSLTKGCYTGQEIVARIHTYGHVNRRLTRLRIDGDAAIERGTPLCDADGGERLGRVMSAVALPGGGALGLGYLPDAFLAEPEPIVLGGPGGPAVQVVEGSFEPA